MLFRLGIPIAKSDATARRASGDVLLENPSQEVGLLHSVSMLADRRLVDVAMVTPQPRVPTAGQSGEHLNDTDTYEERTWTRSTGETASFR